MASAFGDQSYSKLPPIRKDLKGSQADLHEEEDFSHIIDFNREGHGLVRLPPIIRVDSSVPWSLNTTREKELHNESKEKPSGIVYSENKDSFIASQRRYSGDLSFKQRPHSLQSDVQLTESGRAESTSNDSHENTRDSHLVSDTRGCMISRLEKDTMGEHNLDHIKVQSQSLNTRQVDRNTRRASLITAEPQKLHRGRRLAKSSPDLSSTRKIYKSPISEPKGVAPKKHAEIQSTAASPESDSKNELFDISVNVILPKGDRGSPRTPRNGKGREIVRKAKLKHKVNPHSSPSTPVVQLMSDEHDNESPRKGRQSLGDINSIVAPQRGRNSSIVTTRKKLSMRDEIKKDSLRVDGKTCYKNERLKARGASSYQPAQHSSKDGFLRTPDSKCKRDSIYDLQQILTMLNKEERPVNTSESTKRENRSSSVYDLKEFLRTSVLPEAMSPVTNYGKQSNNSENVESLTVPLVVEPGNTRKGSTYDLLEFLSLNFAAAKSKDNVQCSNNKKGIGLSQPSNSPFLCPGNGENTSPSVRRSSAYDLMEFLSLSCRDQNEDGCKTDINVHSQPSLTVTTSIDEQEESRKNSIYNLEEFLGLSKNLPTEAARLPESEEASGQNRLTSSLLSPKLPSNFKFKRESVYDLQEILSILQKETDCKRRNVSGPSEKMNTSGRPHRVTRDGLNEPLKEQEALGNTETYTSECHRNRSLSIYDLREFLSIYANQSSQPNPASQSRVRKTSSISQSSIMINVTEDEFGNESVDDVFLAVPVDSLGRKRSSVSELSEFLNILNDSSRKRIHSNLSSAKNSEHSRQSVVSPSPVSRHDSSGGKTLCDLGEFLSMLNSDDSPLRRRLSSVSDRGNATPSGLSRNDSGGASSLYDLEEFLTILNDNGKERDDDGNKENKEENAEEEISISVPQLPSREEQNANDRMTLISKT